MTTVGVVGSGTMGVGIAIVMARAGHRPLVHDLDADRVEGALGSVRTFLERSVKLGKLEGETMDRAVKGLVGTTRLEDFGECSVVVEAVYEDQALKAELFGSLEEICGPKTLFHTNTSTLSVTAIAAGSSLPERVVGTHYCNPAPLMTLVEVVKARQTSEEAYHATLEFLHGLGKATVTTQDSPGFIVNRFLIPFENDCIRVLSAGLGTIESIDLAVTKGLRYPMGPFRLLDVVGLDVHSAVSLSLYEQLRDPRFAPPPLVDRMIAAGQLGRKTGQGFFRYEASNVFGA
jgi:3-hydroxybutyryl-CoA dehydrogenase